MADAGTCKMGAIPVLLTYGPEITYKYSNRLATNVHLLWNWFYEKSKTKSWLQCGNHYPVSGLELDEILQEDKLKTFVEM